MDGIIEDKIKAEIVDYQDKTVGELPPKTTPFPQDKFGIVKTFIFMLGICHFIPLTFFASANNFWLHKFRNITDLDQLPENRTFMQVDFASISLIVGGVTGLFSGMFNLTIARRMSIAGRLFFTLLIGLGIFVFYTISVSMNTDNYQVTYFILVLVSYGILSFANNINIVATFALYSRLPPSYMHIALAGEGMSGIVGDSLNIITIAAMNNNLIEATTVYFLIGCLVIGLTIILLIISFKSDFMKTCWENAPKAKETHHLTFKESKNIAKKIQSPIILIVVGMISLASCHPAVTSLVVSEQTGTVWAASYFSPVMSYLLLDVCTMIGRVIASISPDLLSEKTYLYGSVLKMFIIPPLIWLSNAKPRSHLPIWFKHDYQYGLIVMANGIVSGMVMNYMIMLIPKKAGPEDADLAFNVFTFVLTISSTLTSFISLFVVNII